MKFVCDNFVPRKEYSRGKFIYPNYIKKLLNEKAKLWKICKQSRNFDHYNKMSAQCAKAISKFKKNRERRILTGGKCNALFSYVNNRLNSKSGISALKIDDGSRAVDDFARSNLFGSAF